ncbi:MAG: TolC family protein [Cetobacterium sp.]|uniref:TolC family protein n=1 Tax=Cetobacterium sp. TaxID=2071632 RepID=UPI002FC606B9
MSYRFLFFSLVFSTSILAQEISINTIFQRVTTHNPTVKVKELEYQIQKSEETQTFKNLYLPPVVVSNENRLDSIRDEGLKLNTLEARVDVFNGLKDYNTFKKTSNNVYLSEQEIFLTTLSEQERGINDYFLALNYENQVKIFNSAIDTLNKQYYRLKRMFEENQLSPKSEYLKILSDIEDLKSLKAQYQAAALNSKESLFKILNYPLNSNFTLKEFSIGEDFPDFQPTLKNTPPEKTTLGKREQLILKNSEYDFKIAKSEFFPTVYVKAIKDFYEDSEDGYYPSHDGRVELGFSYSFNWGSTVDKVNQKKFEMKKAGINYTENIKEIELRMRTKYREIQSLIEQSSAQEKRVAILKENLKIDNLRFESDLITTFDYLNSLNQLVSSQENLYKTQRDLVLSKIEYDNLFK